MGRYEFDYIHISLMLMLMISGIVLLILYPRESIINKNPKYAIVSGMLLLFFLTMLNSAKENQWDVNFIISFLSLKEVSTNHLASYLRFGISVGYVVIVLTSLQLILAKLLHVQDQVKERSVEMNTKKQSQNEKIEYVNARFQSAKLQYAMIVTMFLIVPLGLLYALIGLLITYDFVMNAVFKVLFLIVCVIWIGIGITFFSLRKYWVFKIITSEGKIEVFGLSRKVTALWNEITSVNVVSTGILFGGKMVEVKTSNDKFYFPLTMKVKGSEYPKLDSLSEQWVDSTGGKKALSPESCSLYTEIKKHLSNS